MFFTQAICILLVFVYIRGDYTLNVYITPNENG